MAGSLNHIVEEDGSFTMAYIENMGDAHEALEDCHKIIAWLLSRTWGGEAGAKVVLDVACDAVNSPRSNVPKLAP